MQTVEQSDRELQAIRQALGELSSIALDEIQKEKLAVGQERDGLLAEVSGLKDELLDERQRVLELEEELAAFEKAKADMHASDVVAGLKGEPQANMPQVMMRQQHAYR